jgi:hypothetical protein
MSVAPFSPDMLSAQVNPALLAHVAGTEASLSRLDFFDEVQLSSASALWHIREQPVQVSVRWFGYGSMQRYDEEGTALGSISAYDAALSAATAKMITKKVSAGIEAAWVHSRYGDVAASGVLFSGGLFWKDSTSGSAAGFTIHHAGRTIEGFYGERAAVFTNPEDQQVPFDVRLGFSKRPEHLPVVLHATLHSLHRLKLPVNAGDSDEASALMHLSRHVTAGIEMLFSPGFVVRAGFDKYRHDQYKAAKQFDSAGVTFGAGIKRGR